MGALVKPQPLQAASILLRFGVKELVDFPCLRPHDVVPGIQPESNEYILQSA